jgi:hypothetical protein
MRADGNLLSRRAIFVWWERRVDQPIVPELPLPRTVREVPA